MSQYLRQIEDKLYQIGFGNIRQRLITRLNQALHVTDIYQFDLIKLLYVLPISANQMKRG